MQDIININKQINRYNITIIMMMILPLLIVILIIIIKKIIINKILQSALHTFENQHREKMKWLFKVPIFL